MEEGLPPQATTCAYCGEPFGKDHHDPADYSDFSGWLHTFCFDGAIDEHNLDVIEHLNRHSPACGGGNASADPQFVFREVIMAPSELAIKLQIAPKHAEPAEGSLWDGYKKRKKGSRRHLRRAG